MLLHAACARARREPASAPVCLHFAGSFGSTQGRLNKAILEYVIFPVVKRAARGVGRGRGPSTTRPGFASAALGGRWAAPRVDVCARESASAAAAACGAARTGRPHSAECAHARAVWDGRCLFVLASRRGVLVSCKCPVVQSTAGAAHKSKNREWPVDGVSGSPLSTVKRRRRVESCPMPGGHGPHTRDTAGPGRLRERGAR